MLKSLWQCDIDMIEQPESSDIAELRRRKESNEKWTKKGKKIGFLSNLNWTSKAFYAHSMKKRCSIWLLILLTNQMKRKWQHLLTFIYISPRNLNQQTSHTKQQQSSSNGNKNRRHWEMGDREAASGRHCGNGRSLVPAPWKMYSVCLSAQSTQDDVLYIYFHYS